jgi:ABC-2 type transport system permease protein
MKKIIKIATTELQTLFYSPVAWLILVIFTFQVSSTFFASLQSWVDYFARGSKATGITFDIFIGKSGLFPHVQSYLYLYIPLLTMSLMSREFSSGSIKLLYSSPITNTQIIVGKYLSMVIYGLILTSVLAVFLFYGAFTVKEYEVGTVLAGMLGLFLLICAYSAIGLFMSSLTSYQVVAAICTLAMLGFLNYVGGLWQSIPFVRDLTYWFSISGRASTFIQGLIGSEDVLYFLIVIVLFLTLTVIRLQSNRQKSRWTVSLSKYAVVISAAMLLGYFSSRPVFRYYYDATHNKVNTLTPNSQDVIKKLKGGLTITTYANALDDRNMWYALPSAINGDISRFDMYTRFKPEIKMKYVYYYDKFNSASLESRFPNLSTKQRFDTIVKVNELNPKMFLSPEEIKKETDLSSEGNKFVRSVKRENGEQAFLRIYDDMTVMPTETEITAAFKRLVMKLPKAGFLTGHGERSAQNTRDRDYSIFAQEKSFRYALINQGFDIAAVTLDKEIPKDITILIITDLKEVLTENEQLNLDKFIAGGGNLLIAGEPKQQQVMNPLVKPLGVQFMPGTLVKSSENQIANLTVAIGTKEAEDLIYQFKRFHTEGWFATMPGAAALDYATDKGFKVTPLLVSDSTSWIELETTNFLDDSVKLNSSIGEVQKSYPTGLALSRKVGEKEQRIIVLGDADCVSNGEISMKRRNVWASNFTLVSGLFYWLSNNEMPIDVRRPESRDDELYIGKVGTQYTKMAFVWGSPILMVLFSLALWIRRRGR